MRRGWVLAGLLTAAALLTAGCGRPSGVDANLTDDWPPFPTPTFPVPAENACYRVFSTDPAVFAKPRDPVRCTEVHEIETIHVGSFAGADKNADYPPTAGGPARRTAYDDCAGQARDFLGDDWRTGRLRLYITTPDQQYWDAAGRSGTDGPQQDHGHVLGRLRQRHRAVRRRTRRRQPAPPAGI